MQYISQLLFSLYEYIDLFKKPINKCKFTILPGYLNFVLDLKENLFLKQKRCNYVLLTYLVSAVIYNANHFLKIWWLHLFGWLFIP